MNDWKEYAIAQCMAAKMDPNFTPRYRVPARRWWQLWKSKWRWVDGVSENTMRLAYGLPVRTTYAKVSII